MNTFKQKIQYFPLLYVATIEAETDNHRLRKCGNQSVLEGVSSFRVHGCYFYFAQAIRLHIHETELRVRYENDPDFALSYLHLPTYLYTEWPMHTTL